jgi:hypothetical protein
VQPLKTDAPLVEGDPASAGVIVDMTKQLEEGAKGALAEASADGESSGTRDAGTPYWAPQDIEYQVYADESDNYRPTFFQGGWWIEPHGNSTFAMPVGWGMEMEVNLSNGDEQGSRPFCSAGYKERNWAVNYGWSWSLMTGFGGDAGAVGAYADYNDLSDPCGKNSIAVGMRYPRFLNFNYDAQTFMLQIIAPKGMHTSAYVSANLQAVSDLGCEMAPWMAFTDCMGTVSEPWLGPGDTNVKMLNEGRRWVVPNACWRTQDYGNQAPTRLEWCPSY